MLNSAFLVVNLAQFYQERASSAFKTMTNQCHLYFHSYFERRAESLQACECHQILSNIGWKDVLRYYYSYGCSLCFVY